MAETDYKVVSIDTDDLKVLIKISVLEAFAEDVTMEKLKSCMASLLEPYQDALVKANSDITSLKSQVADKEKTIQKMSDQISELEQKYDDLEQHGRKGSVRIFGVPENTAGDTDTKVLHVVNTMMKLTPPISIDDLEVTHRVGKPSLPSGQIDQSAPADQPVPLEESANTTTVPALVDGVSPASDEPSSRDVTQDRSSPSQVPRPILVKYVSRRVKDDVMKSRKELKGKKLQDTKGHMSSVFVQDDLTQRRAYLAFQVRQMKRNKQILDTWVSYGKIMAKDNHSNIVTINSTRDLSKLNWGN